MSSRGALAKSVNWDAPGYPDILFWPLSLPISTTRFMVQIWARAKGLAPHPKEGETLLRPPRCGVELVWVGRQGPYRSKVDVQVL